MLERAKPEYISKTYKVDVWENAEDFLEKLAFQAGKLLKVLAFFLPPPLRVQFWEELPWKGH